MPITLHSNCEKGFRKWYRLRKSRKIDIYLSILVYIITIIAFLVGAKEREDLILISITVLLVVIFFGVFQWSSSKRELGRASKEAIVFTAVNAADDLNIGNSVRASIYLNNLLLALSDYLDQKITLSDRSAFIPNKNICATPSTILGTDIFRVIQVRKDTNDFKHQLRQLAFGFYGNVESGYLIAQKFLLWLDQTVERRLPLPQSFWTRHSTLLIISLQILILPVALKLIDIFLSSPQSP